MTLSCAQAFGETSRMYWRSGTVNANQISCAPSSDAWCVHCLQARFDTIEDKLKLVQENLKYFLELMQHKKSDTLEWTIIILIAAEIFVSLYDMFLKVH